MFEIRQFRNGSNYCIAETIRSGEWNYLHSNGKIYHCAAEYWPTKSEAQAILDKFYPKPKHVWEHGDVFVTKGGLFMIYIAPIYNKPPLAFCLTSPIGGPADDTDDCLSRSKFLFNIREKI